MQEMGDNAIQLHHNPRSTNCSELCDSIRLLVMNRDVRHVAQEEDRPRPMPVISPNGMKDLRDLVVRDR